MRTFPDGFLWGTATAAYQIEGAVAEGGRKPSVWDTFAHTPGRIENGYTGDVACDHYHRYDEDVELMSSLGLGAYRFSAGWSRVMPDGVGPANPAGLDFYDRLVDALLERGIVPALTLNHWDMPQALQDRGGWPDRATVDAFVEYARALAGRLGDRVRLWTTHNEPWVIAYNGYGEGSMAPGVRDWKAASRAAHHLLLAHGRAVTALRALGAPEIGYSPCVIPHRPATDRPEDALAARRANELIYGWFLDPVFHGRYPRLLWDRFAEHGCLPDVEDGDMDEIRAPIDFLGVNYYMVFDTVDDPDENGPAGFRELLPPLPRTDCDWPVHPDGLRETLVEINREYRPKAMYVTENGASYDDPPRANGVVDDPRRVEFLRSHFAAAHGAIEAGVPLRGYFVWTLLDNFEWIWGYNRTFGIVHVDRDTQRRTVKSSARFYERVARTNTLP
ncbi:GH1 family beta-glucosidase [Pseudonocardia acaciae]|uniref:GH1 family beta-glucosidase n=1 Tax=Pseudonocardia acaciae TaxID=551276 RepID=UPI00048BA8DD|nr:GH1 family beta-glucosidase [Pseudonocardia acaciae]